MKLPEWWDSDKPWKISDSLEGIKNLPENCVNLIVTDPPYKIHTDKLYKLDTRDYLKNIDDSFGSDFDPRIWLEETKRIMKSYNAYWWCSRGQLFHYLNFAEENKFNYDILFWEKTNPMPTKNNKYLPDTEICIFMRDGRPYFNNDAPFDYFRKVYKFPVQSNYKGHPTPKPLKIIETQIIMSSREKDIVLDPFLGTGTTLLACKKHNRTCLGFEISEKYEKVIKERYNSYKPVKKLKEFF